MSASLVGSEMCIRDRSETDCLCNGCLCQAAGRDVRAACHSCTVTSLDPVSYTHLTLPTICSV
eukprot:6572012-Alexandrium_andersonii.AAC.1